MHACVCMHAARITRARKCRLAACACTRARALERSSLATATPAGKEPPPLERRSMTMASAPPAVRLLSASDTPEGVAAENAPTRMYPTRGAAASGSQSADETARSVMGARSSCALRAGPPAPRRHDTSTKLRRSVRQQRTASVRVCTRNATAARTRETRTHAPPLRPLQQQRGFIDGQLPQRRAAHAQQLVAGA
jgi:hypothetical protein